MEFAGQKHIYFRSYIQNNYSTLFFLRKKVVKILIPKNYARVIKLD